MCLSLALFWRRFHISISHITAKLEASFSVNGEQHTHLFGLFFDWLRLASASSSIGFDWLRPLLRLGDWNFGQGHDHELRNPVSLDSLEKHQKSIRIASETHQKSIRKGSLRCLNIHEMTQPRIQLPFHYTDISLHRTEHVLLGEFPCVCVPRSATSLAA